MRVPAGVCGGCGSWPCRCLTPPDPTRVRTEKCACGGTIAATSTNVMAAVQHHNDTPAHQAWRLRQKGAR